MKKILKVVGVAMCLVAFTQNSNAQFSLGLDLSLPVGDFADGANVGFGGSVGYDFAIGDNMKVGGQVGYLRFGGKEPKVMGTNDKFSSSYNLIPILGNFKFFFNDNTNGLYAVGSIGVTILKFKYEHTYTIPFATPSQQTISGESSDTDLTFGGGIGYLINEKIDFGLRYMIISAKGGTLAHTNLRVAYNF